MTLWGKTMAELDEDHRRMLAERLAREQNATPQQLGQYYGSALQPYTPTQQERFNAMKREAAVRREYHFGTDIPHATMEDVEMARAVDHGQDDAGYTPVWAAATIVGLVVALATALLYLAIK